MNSTAKNGTGIIFFSIAVILLLRLVFIGLMGLMPQDAYYDFYGEHLALSYYDHPPLIGYVLRLFTEIFGKKVFVLKLADSLICFLTILFFYRLALLFIGRHRAQRAVAILFSTLMVTILSLISTPDVPLILFWTISLLLLYNAIFLEKKIYWIWSGIFIGLSFDSKYTGVFLLAGLVLFLLLSRKYRPLLFSRWTLLCFLFFFITISPVIIWNVQNDFASFKFQSAARVQNMGGLHIDLLNFAGALGHQTAVLMPILFFAFIYFLFRVFKKYRFRFFNMAPDKLFLLCFFIPVFFGFFSLSFLYWVKLNWMMPAYISGIIWISMYLQRKWITAQLICSLVIHLVLAAEILFYPVPIKSDDTWIGWEELAKQTKNIQANYPDAFIFSADDYKTSAALNFYLNQMVYSREIIGQPALQFDFVGSDLKTLTGKNALLIDSDPSFTHTDKDILPHEYSGYFDSITPIDPILVTEKGRVLRKFSVYICKNYHPRK